MKKFLLSLLIVFVGFGLFTAGAFVFSGCSTTEETPDDGEIGAEANINFTVRTLARTGANSSSTNYNLCRFNIIWYDENGTAVTWGNTPTYTSATGYTTSGGTSSSTYCNAISQFSYSWTSGSPRRYARISCYDNQSTGYTRCGVTSSPTNSNTQSANSTTYFYLYGAGNVSTSQATAKANCSDTLTGIFNIVYRKNVTTNFVVDNYTFATKSGLAGISYTLPGNPSPSDEFYGWGNVKENNTIVYSRSSTTASFDNAYSTLYAKWNKVAVTYDTNGGYVNNSYSSYYQMTGSGNTDANRIISLPGRDYWKAGSGTAYMGYVTRDNAWCGPLLVSKTSSAVSMSQSYDSTISSYEGSFSKNGATWYYSSGGYFFQHHYLNTSTYNASQRFRQRVVGTSMADCAQKLVDNLYMSGSSVLGTKRFTATVNYGGTYFLFPPTPIRTGYTFAGWFTAASGGTQVLTSTTMSKYYDHTLYAHWTPVTYTLSIRFDYYGLNPTALSYSTPSTTSKSVNTGSTGTVTGTYGTTVSVSLTRSEAAYNYYIRVSTSSVSDARPTSSNASTLNSGTYSWSVTGNKTIYVGLSQRYTISFNGNGNTGGTVPSTLYKLHGYDLALPTNTLTRTGYTANGWNTNASGTGTSYTDRYMNEGSVTMYAKWNINTYYLTFNVYCPGNSTVDFTFTVQKSGSTLVSSTINKNNLASTPVQVGMPYSSSGTTVTVSATASGHTFYIGYSAPTTGTITGGTTYSWTPNRDQSVNIYVSERLTLTYDGNRNDGGTITLSSGYTTTSLPYSEYFVMNTSPILATNNLTRTGFTAYGWNDKADCTGLTMLSGSSSWSFSKNMTLYANWTPKSVKTKFYIMSKTLGETKYSNVTNGNYVSIEFIRPTPTASDKATVVWNSSNLAQSVDNYILEQTFLTMTPTAASNYIFLGARDFTSSQTSPSAPNVSSSNISTTLRFYGTSDRYVYLFFSQVSDYQLKYDIEDEYYYFEDGCYPQTYVGTFSSTLNNELNAQLAALGQSNATSVQILDANDTSREMFILQRNINYSPYVGTYNFVGIKSTSSQTLVLRNYLNVLTNYTFTRGEIYWFVVELIRWRVSDYGTKQGDVPDDWYYIASTSQKINVVSDKAIYFGSLSVDQLSINQTALDLGAMKQITDESYLKALATNDPKFVYNDMETSATIDLTKYGTENDQIKVVEYTASYSPATGVALRVASLKEIDERFENRKMRASQMVAFLSQTNEMEYVDYFTRDLGLTTGNGTMVASNGSVNKSVGMRKTCGMALSTTLTYASRGLTISTTKTTK